MFVLLAAMVAFGLFSRFGAAEGGGSGQPVTVSDVEDSMEIFFADAMGVDDPPTWNVLSEAEARSMWTDLERASAIVETVQDDPILWKAMYAEQEVDLGYRRYQQVLECYQYTAERTEKELPGLGAEWKKLEKECNRLVAQMTR